MAVLTLSDESAVKRKYPLSEQPIVIGRHPDCDIQIEGDSVSRQHARITFEQGHFYLQDLNSRNGTYLNDHPVHAPTKIYDQSEIKICDVSLLFHLNDAPTNSSPRRTSEKPPSDSLGPLSNSSVFIDDFANDQSQVMSQLDVPSHHSRSHQHTSAGKKLEALTKITHAVSESVKRDEILARILDCLFELFVEADRGFIILKNPDGKLEPLGVKTRRPVQDEMIRISRTIINQVLTSKRPVISSDAAADDRFDMSQSIVDFRIRSMMCAPMINSKDEPIGVIQLDTLKKSIAFNEEDLETLVTVAMQASLAVQKSDLFEEAKRADDYKADLKLAHEIQQKFLPQRAPECEHYEFYSYYRPMQQVGGDYYDYIQLDQHRIAIVVADVVGHGIPAALLMAKASAEARFALARSSSPVEAVSQINNSLAGMNLDRFVTFVLALLDTQTNQMTIINAGHMPPLVRSADGEYRQVAVEEAGIPLGIYADFEYESITIDLAVGDVVVMYTDGITEAMNSNLEQLTIPRMVEELQESQTKTPLAIGEQIGQIVARHTNNYPAIDDMCIVCVGRTE